MEKIIFYLAIALIAVLVLTFATNIIVAITKKVIAWGKFPVQAWVFIVAMGLTFVTAGAGAAIYKVAMLWYYWAATAIIGLLVCYAAMFGYDNLYKQIKETYEKAKSILADFIKPDKAEK